MPDLKIELNCDFLRKIGENSKFCYKSSEYQNFTGFFAIQQENGNSNMFCKFQYHNMQIFFRIANFLFSKNWKGCINPPTLWLWQLTLPPGKVVPSVGASTDSDSMGESESGLESGLGLWSYGLGFELGLHLCGLGLKRCGLGLWSYGLGLGLHPGGLGLAVSPGESGGKCTRQI